MQRLKEIKESITRKRKLNYQDLNDILKIGKKILGIFLILIIILSIYICVRVCKELNVSSIIVTLLSILSPLFIGIVIALPLTIVLLATYRFYEEDISQKIENIKMKKPSEKN